MGSPLLQIAVIAVLVAANAVFAGSEVALISLREGQLRRLETQSETGRILARLAREPNRFLATIQVGITLAGFLASAFAAVTLAEPLVGPLGFLGRAAEPVAIVLVTLALSFVMLVAGELVPKRIAMQRAERWSMLAARPLSGLARAATPIVYLLSWSTNVAVRFLGGDPDRGRADMTEDEVREIVESEPLFSPGHRTIISGAFEIGDRVLREVLIPRREVTTLQADQVAADALRTLANLGRSRAPVLEDADFDSVIGVAHMRELIDGGTVRDAVRAAPLLPETLGVLDALQALQAEREQMAIVIDEHGGAEGIITVEDLLEEIVGEIYDETDAHVVAAERRADGSYVVPGVFSIHDLADLGIHLPEGDYATVAGLMLDRLGRIPVRRGECIEVSGWRLCAEAVDRTSITRVSVSRIDAAD